MEIRGWKLKETPLKPILKKSSNRMRVGREKNGENNEKIKLPKVKTDF